jgi:esterase FrsA
MRPDQPGGWVHEWSLLAARYVAEGRHDLAALACGWAKFPVLTDAAKRAAYTKQIEQYQLATPTVPVIFERQLLTLAYRGATTPLPVHLLAARDLPARPPVLIASGDVDTWKINLHLLFLALALGAGARVLAFDIPGTGESQIPLSHESTEIIQSLTAVARTLGNGRSRISACRWGATSPPTAAWEGIVDAAVVLGGPSRRPSPPTTGGRSGWPASSASPAASTTSPQLPSTR